MSDPGTSPASEARWKWYVTYTYDTCGDSGFGATAIFSSLPWFPLKAASDWIKKTVNARTVIVLSWRSITDEQYREFIGEEG